MNTISFVLVFVTFCFSANAEKQSSSSEILKNLFIELETYKSVSLSVDALTKWCDPPRKSFIEYKGFLADLAKPPKSAVVNLTMNIKKTRFIGMAFYDNNRVKLSTDNGSSDFINANYVDGYNQKNAFILTQGPMPHTSFDFWKMFWEQNCLVISMAANFVEETGRKCFRYWNTTEGGMVTFDYFQIKTASVNKTENYEISRLVITNLKTKERRNAIHCHYTTWHDFAVPPPPEPILEFLNVLREKQAEMVKKLGDSWTGHLLGPPIIAHCAAGAGRTGTLIVIYDAITRFIETKTIAIRETVVKVRSQRFEAVESRYQYLLCYLSLIEYAKKYLSESVNLIKSLILKEN